ncbi:UDP-3-O-[3-hydroxymyristoyl] N-acetylglucosamine deacetylase [Paracoccus isoporae]|uniref:UDP-3-O-acyl-N-acetylglucosamine deacetylase n=1 Tax=Paracoccus isoporae TaxID=591205 RepID=A0A1G7AVI6_9RHOB|nr:UDP-3-O-acyl-N-acetylglucosamine deacetylase [Paracoccus isoporae]SDE18874.1 UDP-3-O-[3-hydroxymyristoyl] N-acetylglucosamine deacetylase [Paracoccus isoporae]
MQATIAKATEFRGVGLHSGVAVRMEIRPAPVGHGIVFERSDLPSGMNRIPALWDRVVPSKLCTLIENDDGVRVSTIEHIMAALAGTGIQNALLRIDAGEVPILDGSSADFVAGILAAGIRMQDGVQRAIRLKRPVEVREGEAVARLEPADHLEIDFHIEFADKAIGRQDMALDMANGAFVRELMDSRTFCRQSDVQLMRNAGLALGGTYLNAVVVDGDKVLSPGGLRHKDEAVRHKMLDAMGDLALAGAPLLARYSGHRAGHAMTNKLLRALFAQPDAWEWESCASDLECRLPGAGVAAYGPVNAPALVAVA